MVEEEDSMTKTFTIERWTSASRMGFAGIAIMIAVFAVAPVLLKSGTLDRLTALFIYVMLAAMWNALAGYGGLVSIGQQMFFGLGAYFTIRLADAGINPFAATFAAAIIVAGVAWLISYFMLHLKAGEFAIGMWVLAEFTHLLVNLDNLVQGETGTSLISMNAYASDGRRIVIYLMALVSMLLLLGTLYALLRSKSGVAIQAIRDNEVAATSVGVDVIKTKRKLFVLAAFGIGLAGALWLCSALTFQPKTYFSVQWTAYMIFMVLVGGIGKFEGAIIGAVLFFVVETWFGAAGVWYLIGLGLAAVIFSLYFPKGIWGAIEQRFGITLLPIGYRLKILNPNTESKS
jgi:branched-chain amino acid transport system permease protein